MPSTSAYCLAFGAALLADGSFGHTVLTLGPKLMVGSVRSASEPERSERGGAVAGANLRPP